MKTFISLLIASVITLAACKKAGTDSYPYGKWKLAEQDWTFGPNAGIRVPGTDSSVTLILNRDKTYSSALNGNVVSQGTFSITTDASYNNQQLLQLTDFKTTGIFASYKLSEINTNGQVTAEIDGLYMNVSNDTLRFSGQINPGGNTAYVFVRE